MRKLVSAASSKNRSRRAAFSENLYNLRAHIELVRGKLNKPPHHGSLVGGS